MLLQDPNLSVWLYKQPVDMRKQFDGLAALVRVKMNAAPVDGSLYVFVNRRRTQMKILYYSKGGYCLWSKRLERGCYNIIDMQDDKIGLNWAQLQCLIDGINWQKMKKNKRF